MTRALLLVLMLAGCAAQPGSPEAAACQGQVNADPEVQDLTAKGAGSENFQLANQGRLRQARQRALLACLRNRGVIPKGGGVEAPRPAF